MNIFFLGPLMFHPRGLGPRPLRPGMRPFGPRGPPFDPREPDAFFRPPFDDIRPHVRPPFGPMGPPSILPPESAAPWRNPEHPPGSWPSDSENHSQRDNTRDKKTGKHPNNQNLERGDSRNNRGRKSRWANVSPSGEETEDSKEQEPVSVAADEKEELVKEEEAVVKVEEQKDEVMEVIPSEKKEDSEQTAVETNEEQGIETKKEEEDRRDS